MAPDPSAPTLADLSEGAVLARILPRLPVGDGTEVGPGDDSAVVRAADGRFVVTTDMMIHGPDFRLAWSSAHDLGWKAAASNLADVAAMGARPTALVIAIAAPASTPVALLEGIADGLAAGCAAMAPGCGVVGGDLSTSAVLTLAVTAFGSLDGREPVLRSGARPGDVVAVAGPLGRAGLGLRLLFERAREGREPSAALAARLRDEHPALVEAQLAPTAPVSAGIAAGGVATAMMDVSDGVVLDARRLARASGVVLDLVAEAVDAIAAPLTGIDGVDAALARALVLGGGEDHAMLACFPPDTTLPEGFLRIGLVRAVAAGAEAEVRLDGTPLTDRGGWDPYLGWDGVAG